MHKNPTHTHTHTYTHTHIYQGFGNRVKRQKVERKRSMAPISRRLFRLSRECKCFHEMSIGQHQIWTFGYGLPQILDTLNVYKVFFGTTKMRIVLHV